MLPMSARRVRRSHSSTRDQSGGTRYQAWSQGPAGAAPLPTPLPRDRCACQWCWQHHDGRTGSALTVVAAVVSVVYNLKAQRVSDTDTLTAQPEAPGILMHRSALSPEHNPLLW